MPRIPLYEKDKAYKRTIQDTREERDSGYGRLLDLKNRNSVQLFWNCNETMEQDGVFILKVNDTEVFLDADQMRKYLRWV